jgi:hypothetical protein
LAETAVQRPDDEVMLFLFEYAPYRVFSSFDGTVEPGQSMAEDQAHWKDIFDNPLTEKQQIALAEAGLIRYFVPEYNEIYKKTFPHDELKILQECYELDFAGLTVEINTEDLSAPLWSQRVKKGVHHIANFDLHDPDKRRSFFSLVGPDGRYAPLDTSGPVY